MVNNHDNHIVCLLAEGSYFHGVAAISNSLVRNGFKGHIVVGYRGMLPTWDGPVQPSPDFVSNLDSEVYFHFMPLDDEWSRGWNLSNLKPHFMLFVIKHLAVVHQALWYFDADMTIITNWDNFERWVECGVVLALDLSETFMPSTHLFRREWKALAERADLGYRPVEGYFNAGFIGVKADQVKFLHAWAKLIDTYAAEGGEMRHMLNRAGKPEFAKMDQDFLNAAVMATDVPFGVLGVEGMGAFPSAGIMAHAMVFDKPWARNYVRDALIGFQPDLPHRAFWRYADGPIRSFSATEWRKKQRALKIARLLRHLKQRTVREW